MYNNFVDVDLIPFVPSGKKRFFSVALALMFQALLILRPSLCSSDRVSAVSVGDVGITVRYP